MTTNTTPLDPEDTTMLRILIVVSALAAVDALLFAMFWLLDRREEKRQAAERDAAGLRRKVAAQHRSALTERLRAGRDGYEYTPMPPKRTIAIAVKLAEPKRGKPIAYDLDEPVRGLRQVTVHDNRVVPIDREVGAA